ncbi:MAG: baseplate J/gp47 family protein [Bernardetiaceae bacterium]|nr:baseplate J/gp47 family protein [Bernardetiaceae bacterium]
MLIDDGTGQNGRFPVALAPDYVKVDERKFEDFLAYAAEFSKLIRYYDNQNNPSGNWSAFFSSSETVILAVIIQADVKRLDSRFRKYLRKVRIFKDADKKRYYFKLIVLEIYRLAEQFDGWLKRLSMLEEFTSDTRGIRSEIAQAIHSRLSEKLAILRNYDHFAETQIEQKIAFDYEKFDSFWKIKDSDLDNPYIQQIDQIDRIDKSLDDIANIFNAFYETLYFLKRRAKVFLEKSLQRSGHQPHLGLFYAFIKLFAHTQQTINTFTERHLNFYYREILQQQNKPPVHDKAILNFALKDSVEYARIQAGTKFLATPTEENQNAIRFSADHNLFVTNAQIAKIYTSFVSAEHLTHEGRLLRFVHDIYVQEHTNYPAERMLERERTPLKPFATLGEEQIGRGEKERTMQSARLGFVVGSPVLRMQEGEREVKISFEFLPDSFSHLQIYLEAIAKAVDTNAEEVFIKTFIEAFDIAITTNEGWLDLRKYAVRYDPATYALHIAFDMRANEAPIVNFDAEIHEGIALNKEMPMIMFSLSNSSYVYAYSLLELLQIAQIRVAVKASGIKNLTLHNQEGALSPDSAFYPFGTAPAVGSYLIVGNSEVFQKTLDDIRLDIEWFDLPRHRSGFHGYYQGYELPLDNRSYQVSVSILEGGRWKPESDKDRQKFYLFRTQRQDNDAPKPKSQLATETQLDNFRIDKIKLAPNYSELGKPLQYSNTANRGFLKLELTAPLFAFAHDRYPFVISRVSTENARRMALRFRKQEPIPMPNVPHALRAQRLSLSYASSAVIRPGEGIENSKNKDTDSGCFFHLYPYGFRQVLPGLQAEQASLLPSFDYEGSILIGITGSNPLEILTLYFELLDEHTITSDENPPQIRWHYLKGNEWKAFKPSLIISDDTNGILNSGIVRLELPEDFKAGSTVLDSKFAWIRISCDAYSDVACSTISITTQALKVTRVIDNENAMGLESLPAFSIQKPETEIKGVQEIFQYTASFNGKAPETAKDFYTRVSERLRHKDKAITIWDYERLILERFDFVRKVKVIPNTTTKQLNAPGNVMIVVIIDAPEGMNPYEPMASNEQLYEIKKFISSRTSPFVKIEVRNPSFERVRIISTVKFHEGFSSGHYLQRLNEELKEYLCSWLPPYHKGVQLGGQLNRSDVITFLQNRAYIDFVTGFSMLQTAKNPFGEYELIDTARENSSRDTLEATRPWSLLVPAEESYFEVIGLKSERIAQQVGIGSLSIGDDFILL